MEQALFSSQSEDHNTPVDIIERIRYVFGGIIWFDPATSLDAQQTVQARVAFTPKENGLLQAWPRLGSLWLNPPFSIDKRDRHGNVVLSKKTGKPVRKRVVGEWVHKWCEYTAKAADDQHCALLVPARVDTEWFRPLFQYPMCFVSGRLVFGAADNAAPFPTVIVYSGPALVKFYNVFDTVGTCGRFRKYGLTLER